MSTSPPAWTPQDRTDPERLSLLTGYGDVFAAVASLLLVGALLGLFADGLEDMALAGLLCAVMAWGLGEVFIRRHRFALTAIVLTLMMFFGLSGTLISLYPGQPLDRPYAPPTGLLVLLGLLSLGLGRACWTRFRVPMVPALTAFGLVLCLGLYLGGLFPRAELALTFGLGGAVFFMALRWDPLDRQTDSLDADTAFWLHLLAAPMLVHPLFVWAGIFKSLTLAGLVFAGLVFLTCILVSLLLDRRSLILASLLYILYALRAGLTVWLPGLQHQLSVGALVLGLLLLGLSVGWPYCRALALSCLPAPLAARCPPAKGARS